jgi:hypothetical protein
MPTCGVAATRQKLFFIAPAIRGRSTVRFYIAELLINAKKKIDPASLI